jgi:hypothetical protein
MRRLVRRPKSWVVLIAACFAWNMWTGWRALHSKEFASVDISPSFWTGRVSEQVMIVPTTNFLSEQVAWQRMLQQVPSTDKCHRMRFSTEPSQTKLQLPAFPLLGFRQHVQHHLKIHSQMGSPSSTMNEPLCALPSSNNTMCHVLNYSVIVTSKGDDLRRLFLNVMSFLTYPSVNDIFIVLQVTLEQLAKNVDYGQRLLDWHSQQTTQITLISNASLWSATDQDQLRPQSEVILWINGDVQKDWTGYSLKTHLQLWKQNPSSLVTLSNTSDTSLSSSSLAMEPCQWFSMIVPNRLLHGLMVHRNVLCYLQHDVFRSLRTFSETMGWDITRATTSMLLAQITSIDGKLLFLSSTGAWSQLPWSFVHSPPMASMGASKWLHSQHQQQEAAGKLVEYFDCCSVPDSLLTITKTESLGMC